MTEFESNTGLEDKIAQADPSPVLSSAADGELQFVNKAAANLQHDLELERVEDLLPAGHKGLVKACLNTGVTLTEEWHLSDRSFVWSYQSADESDVVYIYGYDVTAFQSELTRSKGLPEANPNPVLTYTEEGGVQFKNNAVVQLLKELGLKKIEDVLPVNHEELVASCVKTRNPVTEERQASDRNIAWSYQLSGNSDVVYIYGYDITSHQSRDFCASGLPGVNPNPVLTSGPDGVPRYTNPAVLQLLLDLELENVKDLLPLDHKGLVKACHSTNTALTQQYQVAGITLVWSYLPVDDSDVIYIYGNDITDYC